MDEGNENNPDVVLEENKTADNSQKPSEFENVYVLIMLGLLGIAVFLMIIMFAGKSDSNKIEIADSTQVVNRLPNELQNSANYSDVPGRDKEVLGLAIHQEKGRHYTHPTSGMTLYENSTEVCSKLCEQYFVFYREVNNREFYTYLNDKFPGDLFGDNFDGTWKLARP